MEVMGKVGDWEQVGSLLSVPESKRAEIMQQSSTEGKKSHLEYWVKTDPDASWEELAWTLYSAGEETAAAMVKMYLPKGTCIT